MKRIAIYSLTSARRAAHSWDLGLTSLKKNLSQLLCPHLSWEGTSWTSMKRLRANRHILQTLLNSPKSVQKSIFKTAKPELVKTFCEICQNTLSGNLKLPLHKKRALQKYKNTIRKLASTGGLKSKRNILVNQSGGFVNVLLGSLLSGVIGKLIENYANK